MKFLKQLLALEFRIIKCTDKTGDQIHYVQNRSWKSLWSWRSNYRFYGDVFASKLIAYNMLQAERFLEKCIKDVQHRKNKRLKEVICVRTV